MYITIDNYDYKIIPNMFGDKNSPISHLRNNKCYKRVSFNNWVYQSELEKDIPEDDADWFMEVYLNEKGRLKIKLGDTITTKHRYNTNTWICDEVSVLRTLRDYVIENVE